MAVNKAGKTRAAFAVLSGFAWLLAQSAFAETVSFSMTGTVQNVSAGSPLGLANGDPVVMSGVFDDVFFLDASNPDACVGDDESCPVNWNSGNSGRPWSMTLGPSLTLDASMDSGDFPGIVFTARLPVDVELDFQQGVNGAPFTSSGCGGFVANICTVANAVGLESFEFTLDATTYQSSTNYDLEIEENSAAITNVTTDRGATASQNIVDEYKIVWIDDKTFEVDWFASDVTNGVWRFTNLVYLDGSAQPLSISGVTKGSSTFCVDPTVSFTSNSITLEYLGMTPGDSECGDVRTFTIIAAAAAVPSLTPAALALLALAILAIGVPLARVHGYGHS